MIAVNVDQDTSCSIIVLAHLSIIMPFSGKRERERERVRACCTHPLMGYSMEM